MTSQVGQMPRSLTSGLGRFRCQWVKMHLFDGGVNSKKGFFRRNTKFFWESEDFAGNWETWEIFWETQSNKVKISRILRYFGNFSQKFGTIPQIFGRALFTCGSARKAFVTADTPFYLWAIIAFLFCRLVICTLEKPHHGAFVRISWPHRGAFATILKSKDKCRGWEGWSCLELIGS